MVKILKKGKTTGREPLKHIPPLGLMQRTVCEHVLGLLGAIYQCHIQYCTYILDRGGVIKLQAIQDIGHSSCIQVVLLGQCFPGDILLFTNSSISGHFLVAIYHHIYIIIHFCLVFVYNFLIFTIATYIHYYYSVRFCFP